MLGSGSGRAAPNAELGAALDCAQARDPGRVLCTAAIRAPSGARIRWADVLVLSAPAFARPLRSRVAERGALDADTVDLTLAFVASAPGRGEVRMVARAVLCPGDGDLGRCWGEIQETGALLSVGP